MKIKWLGHASFIIISDNGTKIITDPYLPSKTLNYDEIKESADIVTVSHGHSDHNYVASVSGNPQVIEVATQINIKGIKIYSVSAYHDKTSGSQRGNNIIYCFEVDGVKICHLGDLCHRLGNKQLAELGRVDILLIPVGGTYTIDAKVATEVSNRLKAKVIIPMHYKNERCINFPVASVDGFLLGKERVSRPDTSVIEFTVGKLPSTAQIIVLKPAL